MPPSTSLGRIEEKLDAVKEQLAELATKVAVLADQVTRQNGRVGKLEVICDEQVKDMANYKTSQIKDVIELKGAVNNLITMERRAWKVVIGVCFAFLGAIITIVTGLVTGQFHIGKIP
jgi:predicted nuclease with TOPRIM domain